VRPRLAWIARASLLSCVALVALPSGATASQHTIARSVAQRGAERAHATSTAVTQESAPAGFRGAGNVSCAPGHPKVNKVGATCSAVDAYTPDNFDMSVFAREAQALRVPVGMPVSVQFYNTNCYANPPITIAIRYAGRGATVQDPTRDAKIVATGVTIPPTAPQQYSPSFTFRMPNVGQASRRGYFSVVLDFSGTLQKCDVISVVAGDFVIQGGTSPCAERVNGTRSLSSTSTPAAGPCPLTVHLVALEQPSKAGLSYAPHPRHLAAFSAQLGGPKTIMGVTLTKECLSGCADLLVTVTDPTKRDKHGRPLAVKGASVSASVTPLVANTTQAAGAPSPEAVPTYPSGGAKAREGYLCEALDPANCGTYIAGMKTDAAGHVLLRYWAPGLIFTATTRITADARIRGAGGACGCTLGTRFGTWTIDPFTVEKHLIYSEQGPFDFGNAQALAEWTKPGGVIALVKNPVFQKAIEVALKGVEALEPIGLAAEAAQSVVEMDEAQKEEAGFAALILTIAHNNPLHPFGLGSGSDNGEPSRLFDPAFEELLLAKNTGLLWRYGHALSEAGVLRDDQLVKLEVYEISYCQQGGDCGPGYYVGDTTTTRLTGIHPYLFLVLRSEDLPNPHVFGGPHPTFAGAVFVPYNAEAWMSNQFGGRPAP
jgi:hypothetical protein